MSELQQDKDAEMSNVESENSKKRIKLRSDTKKDNSVTEVVDIPTVQNSTKVDNPATNVVDIPLVKNTAKMKKCATNVVDIPVLKKCKFFVQKKKRNCQLVALKDFPYCAEHFTHLSEEQNKASGRIVCPYDPNHSTMIDFLERHKKICNMRPLPPMPYFSKGLNSKTELALTTEVSISDLSGERMDILVQLVYDICHDEIPITSRAGGKFEVVDEIIETNEFGHKANRHLYQISSLLSLLETENLIAPSTCFVEMGCGKGMLTYYMGEGVRTKIDNPETCRFVLVDRESHRHKRDNKLKENKDMHVERVRIDLADLAFGKLDSVIQTDNSVGYSKHLCGEATDLALRCLLETNSCLDKLKGIVIAYCCHHKCNWGSYVGKEYLLKWGFKAEDFKALMGMSSWAVCGTGKEAFSSIKWDINEMDLGWKPRPGLELTPEIKRTLGIYAKRVLDYGRVLYVQNLGFDAYLSTYVDQKNTLENVAMIATKSK